MDSCEKEFESAGQEARRLAIALKRFTEFRILYGKKNISIIFPFVSGLP
mgnify:CR=1 FL=1